MSNEAQAAGPAADTARKAYSSPRLEVHGSVEALTQVPKFGPSDVNGPGPSTDADTDIQ